MSDTEMTSMVKQPVEQAPSTQLVKLEGAHERNKGIDFKLDLFEKTDINLSAVKRRVATLTTRRTVKKCWQAAWLVRAIECIDLTTLAGDDNVYMRRGDTWYGVFITSATAGTDGHPITTTSSTAETST